MDTAESNIAQSIAKLEALLFVYGEPISRGKARKVLGMGDEEFTSTLQGLEAALREDTRGLMLLEDGDAIQLVTKPAFQDFLASFVRSEFEGELTPAALETISIVSYSGPIARAEIEYIRGVNSNFILRVLTIRGLVDRTPHPSRTNVFLYRPSMEFLQHVGVASPGALPNYAKFQELLRRMREGFEARA